MMNISTLRKLSISYLLLPNLLFIWGWFRFSVSIPIIGIILYLFYNELIKKKETDQPVLSYPDLAFLFVIVIAWTFLSGSGGYSFQVSDFYAHNSKFHDLYSSEWPYYFSNVSRLVRYYFGYYLVPAFIFKVTGHFYPFVIFAWTFIGFLLGLCWVYLLIFKNKILVLLFFAIGGCGTILATFLAPISQTFGVSLHTFHINFGSMLDQSRWVPNQVIPSLIVSCIIIYDVLISKKYEESFFPISLTLIWAIFPFIALSIIYAVYFFFNFKWKDLFSLNSIRTYLLPGIFLLPLLLYFGASDNAPVNGFIWDFKNDGPLIFRYFTGVFLDSIILYIIFYKLHQPSDIFSKKLVTIIFITFLLLSTFVLGKWNDWLIKMNISFLVIFLIAILRSVHSRFIIKNWVNLNLAFTGFVLLFLLLNFSHQFIIIAKPVRRNILVSFFTKEKFLAIPYTVYGNFYQTLLKVSSEEEVQQYMAKKDSFFEQNLARKN